MEDGPALAGVVEDAARLARLEGLEAHARSAEHRRVRP
jgi:histidinol dehydrogenase